MEQRVSVITLGVTDMTRAQAFYEALGWRGGSPAEGAPIFYQAGGMVLALWDRAALAADSCVQDGGGWGGITLAYNVVARQDVDALTEAARAAGATVAREPAETFWGGYDSIIIDPDGHPWEFAHNPLWSLTSDGSVHLP